MLRYVRLACCKPMDCGCELRGGQNVTWDLFISHASEDKDEVARPLAQLFAEHGLSVWFDEDTLVVGDSLRRSIDHGLANCRFGLVILSPHFFEKEWTQKELDGLVAREDGSEKRILPVWHKVTRKDVVSFSPTLADKLGVSTSKGLDHVVREIMRAIGSGSTTPKSSTPPKSPKPTIAKAKTSGSTKRDGTWIMLGDHFFLADSVRHQLEGKLEIVLCPGSGDEEAELAALRPTQYGGRSTLPFAVNNDAHLVRVEQVTTETKAGSQQWTLSLAAAPSVSSNQMTEVSANGVGPDEIARRRAGRILVNDPPPMDRRGFSADSLIEGFIEGSGEYSVKECVVRSIFKRYGKNADWKEFARLKSVFSLKVSGTVEHVLELAIGTVKNQKVAVKFRGRRGQRYSNVPPATIEVTGSCSLGWSIEE